MKFSIITPAYNMEKWISETIEAVINQAGDFEIEYIVVDDGSKDGTARVAKEYEARVGSGNFKLKCKKLTMRYVYQENNGMYQAINNGFAQATGDILAWVNADDLYEEGALEKMRKAFAAFPEIEWLKGITSTIDEDGRKKQNGTCRIYHHDWLKTGVYGMEAYFVEQDSVFWRASLWKKGGPMPAHYRSAGDYWLWLSFAKHAPLWSLDAPISMFRKREGQISKGIEKYKHEQRQARGHRPLAAWPPRLFFYPYFHLPKRFKPFLEKLYPFLFSDKPREYLATEGNMVKKKLMPTFILPYAHAH